MARKGYDSPDLREVTAACPERVLPHALKQSLARPILDVRALGCERDERTLFSDLDLRLEAGSALQLRGPNGAGKTTLLRCIAGLHPDYVGEIRLADDRPAGAQFLFVGHRPGISALLSAAENLRWHLELAGVRAESALVEAALTRVGLPGWDDVPCQQMSAGQQRRVALARLALPTARVPLWLLDEPFTALDDAGMALVRGLMTEQIVSGGAVLFATHQPAADLPGLETRWIGASEPRDA